MSNCKTTVISQILILIAKLFLFVFFFLEKSLNDISYRSSIFDISENEENADDEILEEATDQSKNQENIIKENPEEIRVNNENLEENQEILVRKNTEQASNFSENNIEWSYPVTKEGNVSKRKKHSKSLETRRQENKEKKLQLFNVKEPCENRCPKKCAENIINEERQQINKNYVSLGDLEKKRFILANTIQADPNKKNATSSKSRTIQYFFQNNNGERKQVCKIFFLTTLGYNKKNDRFVLQAISNSENHKTVKPNMKGKRRVYSLNNKDFFALSV